MIGSMAAIAGLPTRSEALDRDFGGYVFEEISSTLRAQVVDDR
jgi:hypothetical protein